MLNFLNKNQVLIALLVLASSYIYWFIPVQPYLSSRGADIFAILISGAAIVVLTELLFLYIKKIRWHILINAFLISVPFILLTVTGYLTTVSLLPRGETTIGSYYDIGMLFVLISMLVSLVSIFLVQRLLDTYFSNNQLVIKTGGLLVLVFLTISFWYIVVPVLIVIYLFVHDQRFSIRNKVLLSVFCVPTFIFLGVQFLEVTRNPSLTIFNQGEAVRGESLMIEGVVVPAHTTLFISDYKGTFPGNKNDRFEIETGSDGHFNHKVLLEVGSNDYTFCFKNFNSTFCKQSNFERVE